MKKTITIMAALAALLTSHSNATAPTTIPAERLNIIPAWITGDGKASVYTYAEIPHEYDIFTIYDEDFNEIKSFTAPKVGDITCTYYTQEREYVDVVELDGIHPHGDAIEIDGKSTGLSIDEVYDYLHDRYGGHDKATLPDGTEVVAEFFWQEQEYGKKYPLSFFMHDENNDKWILCMADYSKARKQIGDWGEVVEHTRTISHYPLCIELKQPDASSGNDYVLTRGIFSDDYNLIYHIYELVSYNEETESSKSWGSSVEAVGYQIYDPDGNLVTSIRLPHGLYSIAAYRADLQYMDLNGKRYIICPVINEDGEYLYVIYRLDDRSNLTMVATTPASKIAPRTPRRGENVTVSLNDQMTSTGCVVRVVSVNGQTLMQENVPAGQSTFDINTSRFPQGVYVVSVTSESSTSSEVAKIIIR